MKTSKKIALLSVGLATIISASQTARASDLCTNSRLAHQAKKALSQSESLLRAGRPALYAAMSGSGIENCSPTQLYKAGANPGEMLPRIVAPETCGAVLTFKTAEDTHQAARFLRDKNIVGAVCALTAIAAPHPVVGSGN